ncbi:hypothetical protein NC651_032042 [Populus alba x Populus x berolinensis]|nr:hypothetical protein NC651_032042 [Populus alba x Populus x berolinensis]
MEYYSSEQELGILEGRVWWPCCPLSICCLAQEDRGREDKLATTKDKELRFARLFSSICFGL